MSSVSSSTGVVASTNSSTWSGYLHDILFPVLFPIRDPSGAYETVTNSINMGFFSQGWTAKDIPDLSGKVYLVTGGNIGLGKETILQLAKHKAAHIYLGARTQSKAEDAIADIKKTVPDAKITWIPLDLANLKSVSDAAKTFQEQSERLDVLVNNAGIMAVPNDKTSDGFEIQFGTNVVGSFLLTRLLLPTLQATAKSTGDARIVNLASEAHNFRRNQGLELDKGKMQELGSWEAYGNSKFANVVLAREHAKRYPEITSVSVHPGVIFGTGLYNSTKDKSILNRIGIYAASFALPDVPTGALNQLWATTAPEDQIKNGGYYTPVAKASTGSPKLRNNSRDSELWTWNENELASLGY